MTKTTTPAISACGLSVRLGGREVLPPLDLDLTATGVTALVGPNGCGKTTLLRSLSGLQKPSTGAVFLGAEELSRLHRRDVARRLAVLPQAPAAPEGLRVRDLVERGRLPHLDRFRLPGDRDRTAVQRAMKRTALLELADRRVDSLSGGQRQRAWIAMCLAQETPILMLDEPTAWLDLAHQVDLLSLIRGEAQTQGTCVLIVLHDLNLAARFADRMVVLDRGRIAAEGPPADLISADLLREVFGLDAVVLPDPIRPGPLIVAK